MNKTTIFAQILLLYQKVHNIATPALACVCCWGWRALVTEVHGRILFFFLFLFLYFFFIFSPFFLRSWTISDLQKEKSVGHGNAGAGGEGGSMGVKNRVGSYAWIWSLAPNCPANGGTATDHPQEKKKRLHFDFVTFLLSIFFFYITHFSDKQSLYN